MIDYSKLNPEQHKAVFCDAPRILCLAGAGTGKTSVLTHRIARLVEGGADPRGILGLTFTRAAGAEIKQRAIAMIGETGKGIFLNTFHAFCVEVIREFAERLGYGPDFSIYDQAESVELLEEVISDLKYKVTPKQVAQARSGGGEGMSASKCAMASRAAVEYEYRLKRNNALDFDGLIGAVKRAIQCDFVINKALRERYRHIFIDEFQDTDPAQWEIVSSIGAENIFVVGDDFQSIYKFRGANVGIILELAGSPEWQTIKLTRNYRSTAPIVEAANALIKHNRQTEKSLYSDKAGEPVVYREPTDESAEVVDLFGRLERNLSAGRTTAVLARTNRQLRKAMMILNMREIPFETGGAADGALNSPEARKLLAWVAAIANPQDDAAFRKVATSYMGKAAFLQVEKRQLSGVGTFVDALRDSVEGAAFMALFEKLSERFKIFDQNVTTGVVFIAENIGPAVGDAINEIGKWEQRQIDLGEGHTAADLLEHVRIHDLAGYAGKERDPYRIQLLTAHGSKGLEFDEVFILGAAQGTFPSSRDHEEERRLFYVAMTRARQYLNISRPLEMADWGGIQKPTERSQFVAEALPHGALDAFERGGSGPWGNNR